MRRSRIYERCPLEARKQTVVQATSISPTAQQIGVTKGCLSRRCNLKSQDPATFIKAEVVLEEMIVTNRSVLLVFVTGNVSVADKLLHDRHSFYLHMTSRVDNLRRRTFLFTRSGRSGYPLFFPFSFCNSSSAVGG